MLSTKTFYQGAFKCSDSCNTQEIGLVMGGYNNTVTCFSPDKGTDPNLKARFYFPDAEKVVSVKEYWKKQGITVYGVLRDRFGESEELTENDKKFLTEVMDALGDEINCFYYPCIMKGQGKIIGHKAVLTEGGIRFESDEIKIVELKF